MTIRQDTRPPTSGLSTLASPGLFAVSFHRLPIYSTVKFPYRYFTGPQRASASKGKYYQGVPIDKLNSDNDFSTTPIENYYDFAANFGNCRHEGGVDFRSGKKPEALVELILKHFSSPGDLVLDSFAGSGTTAAVAHKMGRQSQRSPHF